MRSEKVKRAIEFARKAHEGQVRKYTGDPYIVHPLAVLKIVESVQGYTEAMQLAAVLHDTVEDCDVHPTDLMVEFGIDVAWLVHYLTEISMDSTANRATRKLMDAEHYAEGDWRSQTIKVADLIDNTRSIKVHDPDFWIVYRKEKIHLLNTLTKADPKLVDRAWESL